MKNIKKIIIGIIIAVIVIIIIVSIIKARIGAVQDIQGQYENGMFDTYEVKKGDIQSYVKGVGQITSFNIETLEIAGNEKISEILVSEGTKLEKDQDVMKVTDGTKTRTIKAGISGMFFCIENEQGTKYCIYNLDDIGVKLSLPERDIASINLGQTATINISALDKEITGSVTYISSLPQNERYTVRVKIDYTDDIKFGYTSTASILTMDKKDVISIPYDYLNMTDDGKYYVFKDDKKEELYNMYFLGGNDEDLRTYIEVGTITSNDVEVTSGLKEGDKIVTQIY